jgi:thiamine biosynthesis lipoprotein
MGTKFTLLIDEKDEEKSRNGANAAFKEAERLNLILSDYDTSSELSRFSESSLTGKKFRLCHDLFSVLSHGQKLATKTKGDFDPTLGPLSRLWRIARFQKKMPTESKLSEAIARVGHEKMILCKVEQTGRLTVPGMLLDLGGIAKGYAADRMLKVLRDRGLPRCLIDAGGDLVIGSAPAGAKGWKVAIGGQRHPELPILLLSDIAVATSGDLEQYVDFGGKRFSHLINPHTGLGLVTGSQVTVLASSGMEADSFASAFLVMGLAESRTFIEEVQGVKAYYLRKRSSGATLSILSSKERE